ERAREPVPAARGEPAHDLLVDALIRRHRPRCGRLRVVGRSPLRALGEGEHENRAEAAGQPSEQTGPDVAPARSTDLVAEQGDPVSLMPAFRLGESEQDLPLLSGPARGEVAVDG